ncbi:MAG: polysaccharide pyruvyl transferase family protein [Phocaeicola sp.]
MKIKTITCHDVYNSGASLQAYALQTYLTSLGHEVEIIDYKPDYLSGHYNLWSVSNPKWDKPLLKQLYLLLKLPKRILSFKKKKAFDLFRKKYLSITTKRYSSNEELKDNPPEADLYIAGSDQIWNTIFPNGRDAAFYLNFAPRAKRRISYAASFATSTIVEEYVNFVSQELKNFDSISVREQDGIRLLQKLKKKGTWVCDPVFLLPAIEWNKISFRSFNDKYILIYDFERTPLIEELAKQIAHKEGWKIYSVNISLPYADKCFSHSGPDFFLSLIKDSQMVLSNSFHATAFSIIYEKEFLVIPRKEGINTRMASLLEYLKIPERMITSNKKMTLDKINYKIVNKMMENYINNSKKFLDKNLEE